MTAALATAPATAAADGTSAELAAAAAAAAAPAATWLDIAQVFAGPSGPGRTKGQFA